MSNIAIRVENLSKKYEIMVGKYRHDTLRDQLSASFLSLFQRNRSRWQSETFWALKDVSFEVKQGDVLGIIGRNGAGKSTLLKLLSRITEPTSGRAEIHGRVASLLEVGTGFNPELTGRENIYLNGAILGMKKAEIDRNFDEIVDFAGVEKFIDTPVKRYSSGMYVRLAFGVAAHLEPEILIVDEVLAVGDASFQKKCLSRMEDVGREGRTVLFVAHNMPAVQRLCPEALLLEAGTIVLRGPSSEVIGQYMDSGADNQAEKVWRADEKPGNGGPFRPIAVRVCKSDGAVTGSVSPSQPFSIEMEYELTEPIRDIRVQIKLFDSEGIHLFSSADTDDLSRHKRYHVRQPGHYVSRCYVPANLLNSRMFVAGFSVAVPHVHLYFALENCVTFTVSGDGVGSQWAEPRGGYFRPALDWDIQRQGNQVLRAIDR